MQYMTEPFNPSSIQPATVINQVAAATTYVRGINNLHYRELILLLLH